MVDPAKVGRSILKTHFVRIPHGLYHLCQDYTVHPNSKLCRGLSFLALHRPIDEFHRLVQLVVMLFRGHDLHAQWRIQVDPTIDSFLVPYAIHMQVSTRGTRKEGCFQTLLLANLHS